MAQSVLVIDDSATILKVVELILSRAGFAVRIAPDGETGIALAREKRPDVILLDFVMPKMNGYQICRALAEDESLRDVPVILMSAKGDQVGERFVKVMGIVDYITKPFSPEAITAVVTHTLSRQVPPGPVELALVESAAQAELASEAPAVGGADAQPRRNALAELRQAIIGNAASAVALRLANAASTGEGEAAGGDAPHPDRPVGISSDTVAEAMRSALTDDALEAMLSEVRKSAPELLGDPSAVLIGDLKVVPLAEVLHLLQIQAQTGVLEVTRAASTVELYFRGGKLDLALARGLPEEFLLGRYVIESGLMTQHDLETFLSSRSGTGGGKLLGRQLVKLGYLTEAELKQVITAQTSELVYEILRWNFGRFTFRATRDLPSVAMDASLGLSIEGVLMEGFRRVDEWHLIEREIDNFDVVFLRNEDAVAQMGKGRLTREEQIVLDLVNGKNSVKEIVRESKMGSFEVSKMLYRLFSIKLIRKRVLPIAV